MAIRPLDGSKPRLTVDVPSQPAQATAAEAPSVTTSASQPSLTSIGSTFDEAKKKLLSLGKTGTKFAPVSREAASLQVKDLVRSQGATKAAAPSLDAAGKKAVADIAASKEKSKATAFAAATLSLPADQQLAVLRALPQATRSALLAEFKKDPSPTVLGGLAVALTRDMSPAELKEAQKAMRAGKGAGMKEVAIAAELAARTDWGKSNQDVVAHLRAQLSGGAVRFESADNNALAETAGDGSIRLSPSLARSPEALAATVGHEGTHSLHGPDKLATDPLSEEVSGNLAGATIFKQLKGDPNDPALSKADGESLKTYGALIDQPGAFRARVASRYATEAGFSAEKGVHRSDNRAKVDKIVAQLSEEPATVAAMSTDDFERVLGGIERSHRGSSLEGALGEFGKLLAKAPASVQKAVLETARHDMGEAGQKVISGAMK